MTIAELKALIESNPQCKELADAGADAKCAIVATEIAPLESVSLRVTYDSLSELLGDEMTERIIAAIDGGKTGPLIAKLAKWLEVPGSPGIDIGTEKWMQRFEATGLPQDDRDAIRALATRRPTITTAMVSEAWAEVRPDGKVRVK